MRGGFLYAIHRFRSLPRTQKSLFTQPSVTMIFSLPKPDPAAEPGRDRLSGKTLRWAYLVAGLELVIYWILIIRFPAVMIPVSGLITWAAIYFRRKAEEGGELKEELGFSGRDLGLVKKYCTGWIFISLYGLAFGIYLAFR